MLIEKQNTIKDCLKKDFKVLTQMNHKIKS